MLSHSHCDSSFKKPKDSNSPSSSDENVLLHTSRWTPTLLDKLGVVISENLPEQIIKEWSLVTLSQSVLKDIETKVLKTSLCLRNMDFASVEELWERTRHNKNLVKLLQPDDFHDTIGHSHKSLFERSSFDDFLYTLGCVLNVVEEKRETFKWQYELLFHKFLQMFGMSSMHQPLVSTKETQILGRTVGSRPDLLCTTSNPRTHRPILIVCQVSKDSAPVNEMDESPPNKKPRSNASVNSASTSCQSPACFCAPHVGGLLVHLDRSATSRAILGMTVEKTFVRITSLHVSKDTLEKIRTGDVTRSVQYEVGEQRPWFSYSKPMNYLNKEDRNELVQALLHINTMQKKYEIE